MGKALSRNQCVCPRPSSSQDAVSREALTACPRATSCPGGRCHWALRSVYPAHAPSCPRREQQEQETEREGKKQHRGGGTKTAVVNIRQSPCPGTALGWQGGGESRGTKREIV